MHPPNQGFHTDKVFVGQPHLRLVVHGELTVVDRSAQLAEEFHTGSTRELLRDSVVENVEAALAQFGFVHGDVGVAQHRSDVVAVVRTERDADAHVGLHVRAIEIDWRADHLDEFRCVIASMPGVGAGQQEEEFLAPDAHRPPGGPGGAPKAPPIWTPKRASRSPMEIHACRMYQIYICFCSFIY